jgi:hypothetical protein
MAVMEWLGHADSDMVRHYYHLSNEESRRQMAKLNILESTAYRSPELNQSGNQQPHGVAPNQPSCPS